MVHFSAKPKNEPPFLFIYCQFLSKTYEKSHFYFTIRGRSFDNRRLWKK
ncbi:MAG: hypothetical protein U5L45_04480 [Saprospiraceae bacterium]|nr:hypothetical protein [Saprospiraceae bacterium]